MVLNIVTEQIKETRFLSQVSRSYLSNLDGEPPLKVKGLMLNAENANGYLLWQKLIISASTLDVSYEQLIMKNLWQTKDDNNFGLL